MLSLRAPCARSFAKWGQASLDSASIAAKRGGDRTGANPTDRGKPGTKRHVVVDRKGIPLAALITAAIAAPSSQRTLAWLSRSRRPVVRYERRADVHRAFLALACA